MKIFRKTLDEKRIKKIVYTAVFVALALWFVYRFVMIVMESRMVVFNPVRDSNTNGVLVNSVVASRQDGVINLPIVVKDNRAFVSGARRKKIRVGQNVGGGTVVSVADTIDYDSGMYIIKTRNVDDGVNFIEMKYNCYYIPVYAVHDGVVMIADAGVATPRAVSVVAQDSEHACVTDGIDAGDVVIVSKVDAGQKIHVKK